MLIKSFGIFVILCLFFPQYWVLVSLYGFRWRWCTVHVWVGVFLYWTNFQNGCPGHRDNAVWRLPMSGLSTFNKKINYVVGLESICSYWVSFEQIPASETQGLWLLLSSPPPSPPFFPGLKSTRSPWVFKNEPFWTSNQKLTQLGNGLSLFAIYIWLNLFVKSSSYERGLEFDASLSP